MKNKVILKIALVLLMTTLMVSMFGEFIPVHARMEHIPIMFDDSGGGGGGSGGSSGGSGGSRSCCK